jgi:hypothetical protein
VTGRPGESFYTCVCKTGGSAEGPPACPACDRVMYSNPCLFCRGLCGAPTKAGRACRWPANECPVPGHSAFRGYTVTALREETDRFIDRIRAEAQQQQSSGQVTRTPASRTGHRRTWTDIRDHDGQPLALTPPEPYL